MSDWPELADALKHQGIEVNPGERPQAINGGDISAAWKIRARNGPVFLKTGPAEFADIFSAEAEGLAELAAASALRVPAVLAQGSHGSDAWLALEWLSLEAPGREAQRRLGERLAQQHRHVAPVFGWHRDNTIGSTPQLNDRDSDWIHFFRERRLLVQLQLADSNGYGGELLEEGARLAGDLRRLFNHYTPDASLLHGDLWSGNCGAVGGEPVIYDPAVYYGDRESDLAMTRLFGGFDDSFYRAYEAAWPLAEGHEQRMLLYQLYHVLNHLNLFGRSWLGRALALIRRLNAL